MNDALRGSSIQGIDDLHCQWQEPVAFERPGFDDMFQRLPVQVLNGNEGSPRLLADVIDGTNVAVVKRAGGASLALESDDCRGVRGDLFGQELQRYQAPQPRIARLIDNPHPSAAYFVDDAVVGDGLTCDQSAALACGMPLPLSHQAGGHFQGGRLDKAPSFQIKREQRFNLPAKFQIRAARAFQKCAPLGVVTLQCGVIQLLQPARSLSIHRPSLRSLLRSFPPSGRAKAKLWQISSRA